MMKTSNKKTAIAALSAVLSCCLIGGAIAAVHNNGKKISVSQPPTENTVTDESGNKLNDGTYHALPGNMLFTAAAFTSFTETSEPITANVTAEVTPDNAANKQVEWSLQFVDAETEWSGGKEISDYVTVTPTEDGALTASVNCYQPFGEQIVLTVTSRDNAKASASCTIDFKQQLLGYAVTFKQGEKSETDGVYADVTSEAALNVTYSYEKSEVYTVALSDGEISAPTKASVEYSPSLKTALNNVKDGLGNAPEVTNGEKSFTVAKFLNKPFAAGLTVSETNGVIAAIENNKTAGVTIILKGALMQTLAEVTADIDTTALSSQIKAEAVVLSESGLVFGQQSYTITYRAAGYSTAKTLFEVGSEFGLSKQTGGNYPETYTSGESVNISALKTNFSCGGAGSDYHSGSGSGNASYKFNGWYLDNAKTVPFDGTIPAGTTGNLVLYADISPTGTHFY